MSIHRHAAKSDANQPAIVKALRDMGAQVVIIREPVDLLIGTRGEWKLAEVKDPDCSTTTFKRGQLEFLLEARGPVGILTNISEAVAFLQDDNACQLTSKEEDGLMQWLQENPKQKELALTKFWKVIGRTK